LSLVQHPFLDMLLSDVNGLYYKSKLELKSNLSKILPVNYKFICAHFFFVLKIRLKDLKFEYCQFKLE